MYTLLVAVFLVTTGYHYADMNSTYPMNRTTCLKAKAVLSMTSQYTFKGYKVRLKPSCVRVKRK